MTRRGKGQIDIFCIVGGGAVVMERMKIGDRSFVVGTPKVIKRELSAEQTEIEKMPIFYSQSSQGAPERGIAGK